MQFLNWFIDPIKNHYADFNGRATRKEFWMFVLIYFIIYAAIMLLGLDLIAALFSLALLVPSLAIGARRLHDTGMSGWWQAVGLVPVIGWLVVVVLMVRSSKPGPNKYDTGAPAAAAATATATPAVDAAPAPEAKPAPEATPPTTDGGQSS